MLLCLVLQGQLETFAIDAQVFVGLDPSGICHPAVVYVKDEIDKVAVVLLLLQKVAWVILRLREALGQHQLAFGRAMPDASCVSLTVQRLQQLSEDHYAVSMLNCLTLRFAMQPTAHGNSKVVERAASAKLVPAHFNVDAVPVKGVHLLARRCANGAPRCSSWPAPTRAVFA
eukprot:2693185-Pleurochrysis_carterae.AAC.1